MGQCVTVSFVECIVYTQEWVIRKIQISVCMSSWKIDTLSRWNTSQHDVIIHIIHNDSIILQNLCNQWRGGEDRWVMERKGAWEKSDTWEGTGEGTVQCVKYYPEHGVWPNTISLCIPSTSTCTKTFMPVPGLGCGFYHDPTGDHDSETAQRTHVLTS